MAVEKTGRAAPLTAVALVGAMCATVACGGGSSTTEGGHDEPGDGPTRIDWSEVGGTEGPLAAIDEPEAFGAAVKQRLDDLDARIEALGQDVADAGDASRDVAQAAYDDLRAQQTRLIAKWRNLEGKSAEEWAAAKADLLALWDATQEQVDSLVQRLQEVTEEGADQ